MGWKGRLFRAGVELGVRSLRRAGGNRALAVVASQAVSVVTVQAGVSRLRFRVVNTMTQHRVASLLTREPETIMWLDRLTPHDVLYDIGANIGIYSLYAAVGRGCRVVAIEPHAANYAELVRNVALNHASERVVALCAALSDRDGIDVLYSRRDDEGSGLATFGEARDYRGQAFEPIFCQTVFGYSLDSLLACHRLPTPTHLKVDVDGLQAKVVAGGLKTLADQSVRSLVVELDDVRPEDQAMTKTLGDLGFVRRASAASGPAGGTVMNVTFEREGEARR